MLYRISHAQPTPAFSVVTPACRLAAGVSLGILLGFALSSGTAFGQGIYKSVGPGGKIIYTDKPVIKSDTRSTAIDAADYAQSGAKFDSRTRWSDPAFKARRTGDAAGDAALDAARTAAAHAAELAARTAAAAQAQKIEAGKNRPSQLTVIPPKSEQVAGTEPVPSETESQGSAALRTAADPRLAKAFSEVMTLHHVVEQAALVCAVNIPAEAPRYNRLLVSWRERNAVILARQQKAFGVSFTVAQIRSLEESAALSNRNTLERANASNEEVRRKWCMQMLSDIDRGSLDPVARPALLSATEAFR